MDVAEPAVTVTVDALDNLATAATMLKIDVEGFEAEVISGAKRLLSNDRLEAILIELNGLGARYGFRDEDIHAQLVDHGFMPVTYDPFARRLTPLSAPGRTGNTLYLRKLRDVEERLRSARAIAWGKTRF